MASCAASPAGLAGDSSAVASKSYASCAGRRGLEHAAGVVSGLRRRMRTCVIGVHEWEFPASSLSLSLCLSLYHLPTYLSIGLSIYPFIVYLY